MHWRAALLTNWRCGSLDVMNEHLRRRRNNPKIRHKTSLKLADFALLIVSLAALNLAPVDAFKTTDLSRSAGVVPIRIQDAFIINRTYTYVHNINITALKNELSTLKNSIQLLNRKETDKTKIKLLQLHLDQVTMKFDHILLNKFRIKRGLFNGLGSAISWLTGNMDADDKAKYDEILTKVHSNEISLEHDLKNQVSINKNLISRFNNGIDVIHANNLKLNNYFNSVNSKFDSVELNEQHHILFDTLTIIHNRIDDIGTSLEFCKLNIIHSSILTFDEMARVIRAIKLQLISDEPKVLWELGSVHCSIHNDIISYFIELPLESNLYETLFMLSYPVKTNNEIITIHVDPSLVIKGHELYEGDCQLLNNNYYCRNATQVVNKCVEELVSDKKLNSCRTLVIKGYSSFIKYIPIINQYLMFNISKSSIVHGSRNIVTYPKSTQLIALEKDEALLNFSKPYTFWESNVLYPTEVPTYENKIITNFTFEEIHKANTYLEPLLILEDFVVSSNLSEYVVYILMVCLILIILYVVFHSHVFNNKLVIPDKKLDNVQFHLENSKIFLTPQLPL